MVNLQRNNSIHSINPNWQQSNPSSHSLKVLGRLEHQYDCAAHVELAQQLSLVHVRLLRQHFLLVVHVFAATHLQANPPVRLQTLVHEYLH